MIRCVRIWTAEDGNSSFEEGQIDLSGGARGDVLSAVVSSSSLSFRETKAGGAFEWHDAPVRQFVLTLSGTLEFTTRRGDRFVIHPGDVLLAEDTAGSVREVITRGDKSAAGIAARRAAEHYRGVILAENIQDNIENFTRFVLLIPVVREGSSESENSPRFASAGVTDLMAELRVRQREQFESGSLLKMSVALRLAHQPGALLAALEPFARHGINLMKIESRPIHGTPWVYQFFLDLLAESPDQLHAALEEVRRATNFLRILGLYPVAKQDPPQK